VRTYTQLTQERRYRIYELKKMGTTKPRSPIVME
jgi:hypothetical protein